jgi:hypothetical protein
MRILRSAQALNCLIRKDKNTVIKILMFRLFFHSNMFFLVSVLISLKLIWQRGDVISASKEYHIPILSFVYLRQ